MAEPSFRPNILWIQCDEVRADGLSCYEGNPWIQPQTPNAQRLADKGVVFTNAFCNSPVCMPSRGSELTSQYPTVLGVYHNVTPRMRDTLDADVSWKTFPRVLRDSGYHAVNVGKSHVIGYDVWDESTGCPQFPRPAELLPRRSELDLAVVPGVELIVGGRYPLDGDYEQFGTRRLTRMALEKMQQLEDAGAPWLLRVSYVMPHTPVLAPPPFDEMYDEKDFEPELSRDAMHEGMSAYERYVVDTQQSWKMSPREIARARATYYGLMSALDAEFGLLVERALNLSENTIILITGDHGTMLGENGLWQKQVFNRKVHRVPLVIRAPALGAGTRDDNVQLMDLGPTLLGLCGLDSPPEWRGRDLFAGEDETDIFSAFGYGDEGAFLYEALSRGPHCPRRICIRRGAHRLDLSIMQDGKDLTGDAMDVFYSNGETNPEERCNQAGNPDCAEMVSTLRDSLLSWCEETTRS